MLSSLMGTLTDTARSLSLWLSPEQLRTSLQIDCRRALVGTAGRRQVDRQGVTAASNRVAHEMPPSRFLPLCLASILVSLELCTARNYSPSFRLNEMKVVDIGVVEWTSKPGQNPNSQALFDAQLGWCFGVPCKGSDGRYINLDNDQTFSVLTR